MALVYMATNTLTNDSYIGKTITSLQIRRNRHYRDTAAHSGTHFHNAIRKHGKDVFEWIILEEVSNDVVNDAEVFWIAYFRSIGAKLYNITSGGEGREHGYRHTDEFKSNLSIRMKGMRNSLGHKQSEEHRRKIGLASKGRRYPSRSNEFRTKQSLAHAKTYILLSPEGVLTEITNMAQFSKVNNLNHGNMIQVAKCKKRICQGWTNPNYNFPQ